MRAIPHSGSEALWSIFSTVEELRFLQFTNVRHYLRQSVFSAPFLGIAAKAALSDISIRPLHGRSTHCTGCSSASTCATTRATWPECTWWGANSSALFCVPKALLKCGVFRRQKSCTWEIFSLISCWWTSSSRLTTTPSTDWAFSGTSSLAGHGWKAGTFQGSRWWA